MDASMSYSSDDDSNTTDDTEEFDNDYELPSQRRAEDESGGGVDCKTAKNHNIVNKLYNSQVFGSFGGSRPTNRKAIPPFTQVPNRLRFCLKDITPPEVEGHLFMGLSGCGQFMLSYTVDCNDNIAGNHYSFNLGYKYTIFFWIFQPHRQLKLYHKACLFDDHGVDNTKEVTMTQWKCCDPRVLIVHGAGEEDGEDSYITYVKVPKLGCLDCKRMRENDDPEGVMRHFPLCLKCSLTVHTKYSSTDSDRKFSPYLNLLCPGRIIIVSNGLVHMLHIAVDVPPPSATPPATPPGLTFLLAERRLSISSISRHLDEGPGDPSANQMVQRILSDFSDFETDSSGSLIHRTTPGDNQRATPSGPKYFHDVLFPGLGMGGGASPTPTPPGQAAATLSSPPKATGCYQKAASPTTASAVAPGSATSPGSGAAKRHSRIVTKSFRNAKSGSSAAPATSSADRASAYEFSEDNEKCEKIATLRKRRLADKKYEFSEDNSENIIPFTKIRLASKSAASPSGRNPYRSPASAAAAKYRFGSPSSSPSSSGPSTPIHAACSPSPSLHRGSPIMLQAGFRSPPCSSNAASTAVGGVGSPVAPFMRSPSRPAASSFKPLGTLSPLQLSMTKRNHLELSLGGSMSPNGNVPFLSPRREEQRVVEVPLQGGGAMPERPVCTKKFRRRYVEEDDAASVITSEEDDCISPGYHTSLPMEVHGALYTDMQMISQATYQQLRCPSVVVTQHSFDIEAFTYYVLGALCHKNNKIYDVFYDWAYEPISVCPRSLTICCLLVAQFSALDQAANASNCSACTKKFHCLYHRNQYEGRILFAWNMESGDWQVLDYGELIERKASSFAKPPKFSHVSMQQMARRLAHELGASLRRVDDHTGQLRVLDSNVNKSKVAIIDRDNLVEFHLKRPRTTDA